VSEYDLYYVCVNIARVVYLCLLNILFTCSFLLLSEFFIFIYFFVRFIHSFLPSHFSALFSLHKRVVLNAFYFELSSCFQYLELEGNLLRWLHSRKRAWMD